MTTVSMRAKIEEAYKNIVAAIISDTKRVRVPFYDCDELPDSISAQISTPSRESIRTSRKAITNRHAIAITLLQKVPLVDGEASPVLVDAFDAVLEQLVEILSDVVLEIDGAKLKAEEGNVQITSQVSEDRVMHGILCDTLLVNVRYIKQLE